MIKLPTPWAPFATLLKHQALIMQLSKREIVGRYKGSFLGMAWTLILPLLMLSVYTFVFSVVFSARWEVSTGSRFEFALVLFCGLIVYNLFSECIMRAPTLVLSNPVYVKKVVFPLEVLPWVALCTSLFYLAANLCILIVFQLIALHTLHWSLLLYPFVLLPLALFTLGLSWFLASLGVFVRDIGPLISVVVSILLFLSPIFYPLASVPESFRYLLMLNPITFVVEQAREVVLWGHAITGSTYFIYLGASALSAWAGYAWFEKTRKGFADVI